MVLAGMKICSQDWLVPLKLMTYKTLHCDCGKHSFKGYISLGAIINLIKKCALPWLRHVYEDVDHITHGFEGRKVVNVDGLNY